MEFISNYGLFLAKTFTIVIAVLLLIGGIASATQRRREPEGHIEVSGLNDRFQEWTEQIKSVVLDEDAFKAELKAEKKQHKAEKKAKKHAEQKRKPRLYVLDFDGDVKASEVEQLRHEISAVLTMVEPEDEVLVRLESPGGLVHSYGLAASQLARFKGKNVPLTIAVDRVAASGGYMMACIANTIIAAPFAVIGSIGVIAQLPNFHKLLKKNDIDVELHTAGKFKRTLTVFGENTDAGREKFREELEETHLLFKEFVAEHRPSVDVDSVATGEVWFGKNALEKKLIDSVQTSDEYLMDRRDAWDIFSVRYVFKKSIAEKIGVTAQVALDSVISKWVGRLSQRPLN